MGNPIPAVANALGGLWGYVAAAAVAALLAGAGAGWTVHKLDAAAVANLKRAAAQSQTAAVEKAAAIQKAQDQVALDAAMAEANAQQKIVTQTAIVTKEIPLHVSDNSSCITYGLVRVLDAAATGADAPNLAPGQPDDACAPVSWRALAADLADDYGAARANAEQLNALEASVRALAAAVSQNRGPNSRP